MNNDNKLLVTTDLGAAAALVSLGFSLARVNKQNPRKAEFIFSRKQGIEDALERYWSNSITVPPREYFDNLKMLKSRLYED